MMSCLIKKGKGIEMLKEIANSVYFDYYGEYIFGIEEVLEKLLERIAEIDARREARGKRRLADNVRYRIKSPQSMREKLKRRGFDAEAESAMKNVSDAAGIRIICPYIDDVYMMAREIEKCSDVRVKEVKDYIKNPKPNGYRSYHMIVETDVRCKGETRSMRAEIQIRTMVMNSWASAEHQLRYKKEAEDKESVALLKRCADEMLKIDCSMMKIRDMMNDGEDACKTEDFAL